MILFKINTIIFFVIFNFLLINCSPKIKRAAIGYRWPTRNIPIIFDSSFSREETAAITLSLLTFENSLAVNGDMCIKFISRTIENDYIFFKNSTECSSEVGYRPGVNIINLSTDGCLYSDTIQHELMHRLGFNHEQSRNDRDKNVQIINENIEDGKAHNFKLYENTASYDTPYDFYSLLQYNSDEVTKNNKSYTILSRFPTLSGNMSINFNRGKLSFIDIVQIQRKYGCTETPIQNISRFESITYLSVLLIFLKEASNLYKIDRKISIPYIKLSLEICGQDHYWPFDYPIIEHKHYLYKSVCLKKKRENEPCKFTIECEGLEMSCDRYISSDIGKCINQMPPPFTFEELTILMHFIDKIQRTLKK